MTLISLLALAVWTAWIGWVFYTTGKEVGSINEDSFSGVDAWVAKDVKKRMQSHLFWNRIWDASISFLLPVFIILYFWH